jgi:membrane fusion protein, multidrug efflux system
MPHIFITRNLPTIVIVCAIGLAACTKSAEPQLAQVPEVGVETAVQGSLPLQLSYSGHTAGSREVQVRSRVSGILLKRRYQEGARVEKDSLLFELDPEPARAAAEQARAEVEVQRALAAQAKRERERTESIFKQGLVSLGQRDQVVAASEIADANLLAAQAKLRKAELDLSYCEVRAPISGLTSNEARSEGSLVTAGQDSSLLTRIVQVDPLYVEFSVPDHEAGLLRDALSSNKPIKVRLTLADGNEYSQDARLTFLDNAIEMSSGSVAARAIVPNTDLRLLPGQFVRVFVDGINMPNATTVPRRAVLTGSNGHFVWVLDEDKKTMQRIVTLGSNVGDRVIVKSGLSPGERVVVDGVMKVADGKRVNVATPALATTTTSSMAAMGKN